MFQTTANFPLPIFTPRLILRQPTTSENDISEYVSAVTESMNEIKLWLPWAKYYPSDNQAEEYLRECNNSWLAKTNNNIGLPLWIIDKNTNKFVGNIVMWNIVWEIPKFEFGYWARTSKIKNGYITEAVNALTRYCIFQLGVKRVEIRCEIENIRAQLIPKRLGFELDGVLRNSTIAVANGKLTDTLLFSRVDTKNLPKLDVKWGNEEKSKFFHHQELY